MAVMSYSWKCFLFILLNSLEFEKTTWKSTFGSLKNKRSGYMISLFFNDIRILKLIELISLQVILPL